MKRHKICPKCKDISLVGFTSMEKTMYCQDCGSLMQPIKTITCQNGTQISADQAP